MIVRNRNLSTKALRAVSSAVLSSALGLGLIAGCAPKQARYNYAPEPAPRKSEYVIGASDVLRISVWHNVDLSGEAIVRPDGTITMPLVGDLRAAGRTPGQIRAEITQRLGTFIQDDAPVVTALL